ncbi:hypothetical protein [Streptomyces sp. SID13726]|uniref:hypothetical protein n=1 Tax=Streptomyces sp. SID13726 TaxID=2706058 RepID=UPI0013BA084B|nr:hypothetical protein [Streptomyces sp. SID13726]NEB03935.1 hypothetical protein [Streptomyces sp. SID13726]
MSAPAAPTLGLTRTVLRLHRAALIVWGVFVLASVGYLIWLTEVTAGSVRESLATCPRDGTLCGLGAWHGYSEAIGWVSTFMYYSYWAVAAWAAGALIARELESGTARLAWSQGITPTRWLTTKLTLPALALTLGGALFVPVYRWAWSSHRDLMGDNLYFNDVFAAHGPLVVAYPLCALAIGTLTALLLARPLPSAAIAVTATTLLNHYLQSLRPTSGSASTSAFWPAHLTETALLLTATALATGAAFWQLRRRSA